MTEAISSADPKALRAYSEAGLRIAFLPKALLDALAAALNHDGQTPRGNRIVQPAEDIKPTAALAAADAAAAAKAERLAPLAEQIEESQGAFRRAMDAMDELLELKAFDNKTAASDGVKTLSGWEQPRPPGFDFKSPDEIRAYSDQIGHDLRPTGARDQIRNGGFAGKARASDAEKQAALMSPGDPLGVSADLALVPRQSRPRRLSLSPFHINRDNSRFQNRV